MKAIEVLRKYQKQCDPDGMEVQVSRQALDEVLDRIERLEGLLNDPVRLRKHVEQKIDEERALDSKAQT